MLLCNMSAINIPSPTPADDSGVIARILPNRGQARLFRLIIRIFLGVFLLASLSQAWDIYAELHARQTWPVAPGQIVSATQRDSKGVRGSTEKHTRYWLEYEVRFAVPVDQCRTGTMYGEQDPMPCAGVVRTRSSDSPYTVYQWLTHGHALNARVQVLHEPNGPGVKIAGESAWLVYRWDKIFTLGGLLAFFFVAHAVGQRRLEYLETLPASYTAPPQTGPDGPIDLKLS
jgi:uncharacterized protein DUF3592